MKTPETKKKWLAQRLLPHVGKWRFFLISSLHCGVLVPFFFLLPMPRERCLICFFFFLPHFVLVSIDLPASLSFSSFFFTFAIWQSHLATRRFIFNTKLSFALFFLVRGTKEKKQEFSQLSVFRLAVFGIRYTDTAE